MNREIRRTEATDAKSLQEIYQGSEAYSFTLQLPHQSVDFWEKRLANALDNFYSYVALVDGVAVGNLGLHVFPNPRRSHAGTFRMGVKDSETGKGIGSRLVATAIDLADNWLNLKRLELTVFVDNERALQLYKKFGFQIEGESKYFAFRNGEYADVYHLARIKENRE